MPKNHSVQRFQVKYVYIMKKTEQENEIREFRPTYDTLNCLSNYDSVSVFFSKENWTWAPGFSLY